MMHFASTGRLYVQSKQHRLLWPKHLTCRRVPAMWEERKRDPAIAVAVLLCVAMAMAVAEAKGKEEPVRELSKGFTAAHSAGSAAGFEPVLYAPNGVFAFGFLRVGESSLDLAVVHLPSSFALWRATPARTADWARPATLSFDDGRLALSVPGSGNNNGGVLWSTLNIIGDTVVLLNSSDLVIRRYGGNIRTPWRSFDNPSNTLVAGQNFSGASSTPLVSSNRRFALRMGKTFMALHMEFYGGRTQPAYWRYTAREAEAQNATQPPVYGRVDIRGFFALYVGEEQSVDMIAFDTFVAKNLTAAFRRMTLEDDGNLRAYYWAEDSKAWVSDYKAITDQCGLPTSCGAYGLCVPGAPARAQCQCLVNTTDTAAPLCRAEEAADLCADGKKKQQLEFEVVRRRRVSVAYKEQLPPETNKTAAECEESCAGDCGCWGAVYSGGSGYCYRLDFPVETLVYEEDDMKVGYFKVRKPQQLQQRGRRGMSPGAIGATVALALVLVGLAVAGAYEGHRRRWRWRRDDGGGVGMEQELTARPYKDLKSMDSSNNSFKA